MKKLQISVKALLVGAFIFGASSLATAQNIGINSTGATPDASAALDVSASDKGMLVPRVALTGTNDATTIATPATSLLVYNTATAGDVTPGYYYFDGAIWQRMVSGASVGTDDQNITGSSLSGTNLTIGIEGGTSQVVNLAGLQDGTGTDSQTLNLTGSTLSISGGNSVTLTDNVNDADADVTNEIQSLSISGSTVSLSNGGGSVAIPSSADNLGNHTATQNLNLATSKLVGNGGSTGILIQSDGHTRVENLPQYTQSTDTLLVVADNLGNLHNISLDSLAAILIRDYGVQGVPDLADSYPSGAVFCVSGPTVIVDVTNPSTGKTWMDRNLGASQVATSSTDAAASGDLYQWGRPTDGHQCRTSNTTATNATTDTPGHGDFILEGSSPFDWRVPQNDNLWQGVNGVNNPCPSGYRIPTEAELNAERLSWNTNNSAGAFGSPLKFPVAGYRNLSNGTLYGVGTDGYYWSSTVSGTDARTLYINSSTASMDSYARAEGFSVRCIKD